VELTYTLVIVPLENVNLEILISATLLEEGIGVSEIKALLSFFIYIIIHYFLPQQQQQQNIITML